MKKILFFILIPIKVYCQTKNLTSFEYCGQTGFLNSNGEIIVDAEIDFPSTFHEGLAQINKNNKFGYIDATGKIVIEPNYDYAGDFNEGLAYIGIDGASGFINTTGKITIPLSNRQYFNFKNGLARFEETSKWGFIDKTGKTIIAPIYDNAQDFDEGLAKVTKGDEVIYINEKGIEVWSSKKYIPYQQSGFTDYRLAQNKTKNGVKQGFWIEYKDTTEFTKEKKVHDIYILTNYVDGKPSGMVRHYFSNHQLFFAGNLDEPMSTSVMNGIGQWFNNGQLMQQTKYTNGKRHGRSTWLYANGNLKVEEYYEQDTITKAFTYYESGKLFAISNYKNGLQHGNTTLYYETGSIKEIINYMQGEKKGIWIKYKPNGEIEQTGQNK